MQLAFEMAPEVLDTLKSQGAFLVAADDGGRPNVMTIGWGAVSFMWRKPCFIAPVRLSRYTHGLLENGDEFTVSFPQKGAFLDQLKYVGTHSGASEDKFKASGLSTQPGKTTKTPVVAGCSFYMECKILARTDMLMTDMDESVVKAYYDQGAMRDDTHTLFFAEIINAYQA